jgi:hypothetical protein
MIPAASTTALITTMGSTVWQVMYDNLPIVFGIVVAIAVVFWAFRRIMAFFNGGKK